MSEDPTEKSDSLRCSTAQGIIESLEQFGSHLINAKRKGMSLRSFICDGCQKQVTAEFFSMTEVQTKFIQCPCGTVNRVTYRP